MDFNIPEELKMVQTLAHDFVKDQLLPLEREVLGREVDMQGVRRYLPPEKEAELKQMARENGLWGVGLPESLGGAGLGVLGTCLVEEELARTVLPFSLGDVTPLLFECNEEQKVAYLLPAVEGTRTPILALIEPGKPDDPLALTLAASEENGDFILNGAKVAYGRASGNSFAIAFAVTDRAKGLRGGVTAFLVDRGTAGFRISGDEPLEGWQAQVPRPLALTFEDCRVPASHVLGERGGAFKLGAKYLPARRIVRSARSVGAAARLLEASLEHAKSWQTQGRAAIENPENRALLADMYTEIQAARLMVLFAASRADEGVEIQLEAAMAKVSSTRTLLSVADRAVLVRGGPGPAGELPLQVLCRDLLAGNLAERTLEVQKAVIAARLTRLGAIF